MTVQRFKQLSPLLVGNFANNSEDKTNLAFRATVQYTILRGYFEVPVFSQIYGGESFVCALFGDDEDPKVSVCHWC